MWGKNLAHDPRVRESGIDSTNTTFSRANRHNAHSRTATTGGTAYADDGNTLDGDGCSAICRIE